MIANGKTVATVKINHFGKHQMKLNQLIEDQSNREIVDLNFETFDQETHHDCEDSVTLYQAYLLGKLLRSHPSLSTTSESVTSHC